MMEVLHSLFQTQPMHLLSAAEQGQKHDENLGGILSTEAFEQARCRLRIRGAH